MGRAPSSERQPDEREKLKYRMDHTMYHALLYLQKITRLLGRVQQHRIMYRLLDIRAGVIGMGDCVIIEVFLDVATNQKYWLVTLEERTVVTLDPIREDNLPLELRKLMHVVKVQGSCVEECNEGNRWELLGPHLARDPATQYICVVFGTNPIGQIRHALCGDTRSGILECMPWLRTTLAYRHNRRLVKCFEYGRKWLQHVREKKGRIMGRMMHIEKELIERAWHPSRFMDWCLDHEERAWLREQGALLSSIPI